jgi:AbrB family looped-hinge helix DNA binding protein
MVRIIKVRIRKEVLVLQITSKGQVTIPVSLREKFGFLPNTEVEFEVDGSTLRLKKVNARQRRGREIVSRMRGKATAKMNTEQIMALTRGK